MSISDEVGTKENHDYPYYQYIKSPSQLGTSSQGNIGALRNNLGALFYYLDTLVSGHPKDGFPLGNKYFMATGAKCKDKNNVDQPRSIYINNIPDGNIPFISSAMGVTMDHFEGLVPGVLGDLSYINPAKLFTAFSSSSSCQQINMEIKDISNNTYFESKYVLDTDIKDYNPCWFPDKKNPVTKVPCREGMTNQRNPDDWVLHTYVFGVGLLGVYLLYGMMKRK